MAKFDMSINGVSVGAAEGREAWSGEVPPTGSYEGILKILSTGTISAEAKNAGAGKLSVGVELRNTPGGKYDGYIAWGNLNLIESSLPYINQFLLALTDGSDAQFDAIKKAFYVTKPTTDERKKHIEKIGKWNVNSPDGALPIKVSLTNTPYHNKMTGVTTDQVRIQSYLVSENGGAGVSVSTGPEEPIEEEETTVEAEVDYEDEDADAEELLG
jgi:hypothetical protein